jgi:hypothetical protein
MDVEGERFDSPDRCADSGDSGRVLAAALQGRRAPALRGDGEISGGCRNGQDEKMRCDHAGSIYCPTDRGHGHRCGASAEWYSGRERAKRSGCLQSRNEGYGNAFFQRMPKTMARAPDR